MNIVPGGCEGVGYSPYSVILLLFQGSRVIRAIRVIRVIRLRYFFYRE